MVSRFPLLSMFASSTLNLALVSVKTQVIVTKLNPPLPSSHHNRTEVKGRRRASCSDLRRRTHGDMAPSLIDTAIASIPSKGNGNAEWNPKGKDLVRRLGSEVNEYPPDKPYNVCLDTVPVTIERIPYYPKANSRLQDAGTARVNIAATEESPEGTQEDDWAERHKDMTVVQQHCSYWDKDGDGIIWPLDTFRGVRAWGWNFFLAAFATFVINFNLSYPTCPSYLPDPFFRIHIANVHKDKHGSDSMSFDNEGRFRPQNFEDFFAKYDRNNEGGLDVYDLARGLKGQRMAFDFFGWSAAFLECKFRHHYSGRSRST